MSCVSFLTPRQREALARAAAADAGPPLSSFASPPVTAGTLRRIQAMAQDAKPGIRASAAAHRHAPAAVLMALARDVEVGVRAAVARNAWASIEALRSLAADVDAGVRAWVAANPMTPAELLEVLAHDADAQVRDVVTWARNWSVAPVGS